MSTNDRPRLAEVARLAGVSIATASRALSNPGLVAEDTRSAVQDAARSCGYKVNLTARSLRKQRSDTILVLIPGIDNQFYPEIISGLEERARATGFSMILGLTSNQIDRESSYFELISNQRADGLMILDGGIDRLLEAGVRLEVPAVQVLECQGGTSIPAVRVNDRHMAELAVHHLAGLGHNRIAHIPGSSDSMVSSMRREGFRDAMAAVQLAADETLDLRGGYTNDSGRAGMERLLNSGAPPTAVFCVNDASAIGAMRACRQHGIRVPQDMSVVGVDDIADAALSDPPLTTIRQPRRDIGVRAMDLLIGLIHGERPETTQIVMPVELILRASTASPRHS